MTTITQVIRVTGDFICGGILYSCGLLHVSKDCIYFFSFNAGGFAFHAVNVTQSIYKLYETEWKLC